MPEGARARRRALPGPVVAVVGPTAVGKTIVGEELALRLGGEIVSADSMQVYRGMDVGTAKPPVTERRVPYHCLDIIEPGAAYSAARYQSDARTAIDSLLARGTVPVVVGGTGLYVRAALDEMVFPHGEVLSPTRARLEALAVELGPRGLHAHLAALDPDSAALIHPNNTRRVIRALEMLDEEDISYSAQAERFAERRSAYRTVYLGLTMERAALYARIDARVDAMVAGGLVEGVHALMAAGYRDALTAAQAIGYKELVAVLETGAPLADAVAAIKQASRRYAKRQLTWFGADPRVQWLDVTGLSPAESAGAAIRLVESGLADQ
jgi:tRNA dimethylallyltransferase